MVRRYLRRAALCRTWGGVLGALLPTLFDYVVNGRVQVLGFGTDGTNAPLGFGAIFVGYLLGALVAEVATVRPIAQERRTASLVRRELADYLPRWQIVAQRALAVAAALGIVVTALVSFPAATSIPSLPSLVALAAGVLAFGAGVEAVERWLVRRPQPFTSPPLVAADDAIRAQSIRAVAGAALALLLLLCCGISLGLQASEVAILHTVMVVPAVGCLIASLLVIGDAGEGRWRVRRPVRAVSA
jgi:hypothetical protein